MNKEEILDVLNAIRVQVDELNVSDYQLDERVSELETLLKVIEDTKVEIKYLSEKLTNDNNYIDKTPYLYDESQIFYLEDNLSVAALEEQDNLAEIERCKERIDAAHRSIAFHEVLIATAERKYKEDAMAKGPELREALDDEFEQLSGDLRAKSKIIETYKENLENVKEDLEKVEAKLVELTSRVDQLKRNRERAEAELSYQRKIASSRSIDEKAKSEDKAALAKKEAALDEYDRIVSRISYDHDKKIVEMISDYKTGAISHEELVARLEEFKEYLDKDLVAADVAETYSSEEFYSNNRIQEELEREIAELEARLANEDNYSVSPFVIEKNERALLKAKRHLETIDNQIKSYTEENQQLQDDIITATELIEESELEIEDTQRQIRRLGADIDPETEKLLLSKISNKRADIKYLENTKTEAARILEHNSVEIELLASKQERFRIVIERMEASLSRKNSIDLAARRLDETILARKKDALVALKRRGLVANISLIENIDKIIGSEEIEKVNDVEVEEIVPDIPGSSAEPVDSSNEAIEENVSEEMTEPSVEETEPTTLSEESLDEVTEENTPEGPTVEELEETFGMDPIGLGDTRGWKFKYSGVEDEELAKKAKDKKFAGKLKGFFKGMLNVIPYAMALTTSLVLAGIHPIKTAKAVKEYLKRAQKEPEKCVDATPEDVERGVRQVLKEDGVNVENLNEEVVEPETIEPVVPEEVEDEIVIPTSDGESFSVDVSGNELETQALEAPEAELEVSEVEAVSLEETASEEEIRMAEALLEGIPSIDEEAFEMEMTLDEAEEEAIEGPEVQEQTEEVQTIEETVESVTSSEEQQEIEEAEKMLATLPDEELDIPVEAESIEEEVVEDTLSSRLARLSEDEINDIIAQISQDMGYEVSTKEVEETSRKLR